MEYGFLSVIPPLVAIILAVVTRQVLISLAAGLFVGTFILSGGNLLDTFLHGMNIIFDKVGDPTSNTRLLLYVFFLGGVLGLLTKSGGMNAFAKTASEKVRTRKGAMSIGFVSGLVIFFCDYFNSLTVGSIMRPIVDRFKISREKLAYIVDSTAAPVCILVPISSWGAYCIGLIGDQYNSLNITGISPFVTLLKSIPLNFYSWLALIMVAIVIYTKLDFGPMAQAERRTLLGNKGDTDKSSPLPEDDFTHMEISDKSKTADILFSIFLLIAVIITFILYTGGLFEGKSVTQAFADTDSITALAYGCFIVLAILVFYFRARKILTITESMEAVMTGMKSMLPGNCILALAWSIGGVTVELGTGEYLSGILSSTLPAWSIPVIIFVVSCIMAFATGTSWATYALMIPLAIPLALALDGNFALSLAAVFSGGIFGDHCSPISDTTILSSVGAGCHHIAHVNTQLPYALTVAVAAFFGFIVVGVTNNCALSALVALGSLTAMVLMLHKMSDEKVDDLLNA